MPFPLGGEQQAEAQGGGDGEITDQAESLEGEIGLEVGLGFEIAPTESGFGRGKQPAGVKAVQGDLEAGFGVVLAGRKLALTFIEEPEDRSDGKAIGAAFNPS